MSFVQQQQLQPRWKNIRYEEISNGFVSTSSQSALFCRTLASFSQPPSSQSPSIAVCPPPKELWTRFRFANSPTILSSASANRFYGEKAVAGVEISSNTNNGGASIPALLHVLLRCDGTLCVKRATSSSPSDGYDTSVSDRLPFFGDMNNNNSSFLMPPTVSLLRGNGDQVVLNYNTTNCDNDDFFDESPIPNGYKMFQLPPCCCFTPGSTILVRTSFAFASCIVIEWLIFCTTSVDFVNANNTSNNSSSSNNNAVMISMTIPVAMTLSSSCASLESCFVSESVAGQSANLFLCGNRHPFDGNNKEIGEQTPIPEASFLSKGDEKSSPTAEFFADFVVAASRNLIFRAPLLLLSSPSYDFSTIGDTNNNNNSNNNVSSPLLNNKSITITSPIKTTIVNTVGNNTCSTEESGGSLLSSSLSSNSGTTFTTAEVLRLATSESTRRNLIRFNTQPSYVNLRGDCSFERMSSIVDSI